MEYFINPAVYSQTFPMPTDLADKYLKLAKGEHIKVLIYIMRNVANLPDTDKISAETDVSVYDVKEALLFWADAGILIPKETPQQTKEQKTAVKKVLKPQREDVAKRGLEDPKIRYMLNETQLKFGRNLKTNETSTLVWLYDDQGLDVSLILLIVQYAVTHGKPNIRFIESVATDWLDKGIDNLADADDELRKLALSEQAWATVQSAFGIDRRKPSKKESELALKWIDEWKISKEMLAAAYEACVDSSSKFTFPYVAKIIENWHEKGYKTIKDLENDQKPKDDSKATYDLDLFEKMLDAKD
jgi:DnaD/phage-associated family protein